MSDSVLGVARVAVVALWAVTLTWIGPASAQTPEVAAFASLVERLSEPGGDFGGDNLISNEQSYLHVMPALLQAGVSGGAYLGVGPDQNFSYIAQIKPAVVYLIDIRRDNLLLHLLFKAIFAASPTRVEYLCLLTGRPPPERVATWHEATIDAIVTHVDGVTALPDQKQIQDHLDQTVRGFGFPLNAADHATIASIHRQFVTAGLSLVFQVRGRPSNSAYPSLRTLLQETDRAGHQLSFLATESGYQFVRSLQARHLIVPVVGDVSGPHAMRAIAADMSARGESLSVFYISNVEFYLFRSNGGNEGFAHYVDNLRLLPHNDRSTIIRSVFPSGGSRRLPQTVPGFYSTSIVQSFGTMLQDLAAGKYRTYGDLISASSR